jgi:hypothetical protein
VQVVVGHAPPAAWAWPACPHCGKDMVHVARMYAEGAGPRALSAFACPHRACQGKPGTWSILRTQVPPRAAPVSEPVAAVIEEPVAGWMADDSALAATGWGGGGDWGDVSGGEGGCDVGGVDGARREREQAPDEHKGGEEPGSVPFAMVREGREFFAMRGLLVEEEPWSALGDWKRSDTEEGDDDGWAGLGLGTAKAAREALSKYEETPAEAEAASEGGTSEGGGEKYEADPPGVRELFSFQARLSALPAQCVRYAWEGDPLWPVSHAVASAAFVASGGREGPKRALLPPPCEQCGAPRVFEAQFLPTIVSDLASSAAAAASASEGISTIMERDEIDVGSVMVYSCSKSCGEGGTEWCCVLPPL